MSHPLLQALAEPWPSWFLLYFQAWISGIRAGTNPSCGNHIKSSCSLIAFNSDRPGRKVDMVMEIQILSPKQGGARGQIHFKLETWNKSALGPQTPKTGQRAIRSVLVRMYMYSLYKPSWLWFSRTRPEGQEGAVVFVSSCSHMLPTSHLEAWGWLGSIGTQRFEKLPPQLVASNNSYLRLTKHDTFLAHIAKKSRGFRQSCVQRLTCAVGPSFSSALSFSSAVLR